MDDRAKFLRGFGSQIHTMRKNWGLTQKEFAKVVGISSSYIASIETGRRWPHINILYAIANNLGTTPYELINRAVHSEYLNLRKKSRISTMNKSDTSLPSALDKFLNELELKANKKGYPQGIILNMRHHPEMLDIMIRMIGAELECIKKEREAGKLQKEELTSVSMNKPTKLI